MFECLKCKYANCIFIRQRLYGKKSHPRIFKTAKTVIYVKDYADGKFGCFPVAQPKTCHCRPRELPGSL